MSMNPPMGPQPAYNPPGHPGGPAGPGIPIPQVAIPQPKQMAGMFPQENVNFVQIRNLLLEILGVVKDIQNNLQADMVCTSHDHNGDQHASIQ